MTHEILIGAHTSAAGGAPNALNEGNQIGATTIQLFTSNQKQWTGRTISQDEINLWEKTLKETSISHVMSHASYLINLGSPDPTLLTKGKNAFREEIERCHLFHISYLNFHPGAATKSSEEECLDQIVKSLLEMEDVVNKGDTKLVLETTAGQGTSVGHTFQQIEYILKRVHHKIPVGVCVDTCHIFAAGYDIRTDAAWEKTLTEFDETIGLKHLTAFHVNDSQKGLGSKVDRHACLGEGEIGHPSFRYLMQSPKTGHLPKYLETPNGPAQWEKEITLLRSYL